MQAPTPDKPGSRPAGGRRGSLLFWLRPGDSVRRIRRCLGGGFLLALATLAVNESVPAVRGAEQASAMKRLTSQPRMTPESAAGIARRETGGRVLSVTRLEGGEQGYRVRVLLDGGRVTTVLVGPGGGIRRQR